MPFRESDDLTSPEEFEDRFRGEEMKPFVPDLHQAEDPAPARPPVQGPAAQPLASDRRPRNRFWQRLGRLLARR